MTVDVVDAILLLAPGFLALKVFYLLGAQRGRSEWEWTTWSVIVSLPIVAIASVLRLVVPGEALEATPDAFDVAMRLAVAVAIGATGAIAWREVRLSRAGWANELRMDLNDSAWDQALEDAVVEGRAINLVLEDDHEYRGTLRYADRDDTGAPGWIYIIHVETLDARTKKFRPANGTHGILVHRDRVKRIRSLQARADPKEHL